MENNDKIALVKRFHFHIRRTEEEVQTLLDELGQDTTGAYELAQVYTQLQGARYWNEQAGFLLEQEKEGEAQHNDQEDK